VTKAAQRLALLFFTILYTTNAVDGIACGKSVNTGTGAHTIFSDNFSLTAQVTS